MVNHLRLALHCTAFHRFAECGGEKKGGVSPIPLPNHLRVGDTRFPTKVFLIDVATGQFATLPRKWRFTLTALFATIGISSLLLFVAITRSEWLPLFLFLLIASGIFIRLYVFPAGRASNLVLSSDPHSAVLEEDNYAMKFRG
jgi:hypothetical protein